MKKLSIVVPCYNEQETVEIFYNAVTKVLDEMGMNREIIFVNDGSKDATLEKLIGLYEEHYDVVRVIDFSRNFGKESAFLAGLRAATGNYITVMDADLQDPPEYLPKMFALMEEKDLDVVGTRRISREGEPKIRSFFARAFYKIVNHFTEVEIVDGARDFRLMKRPVVDAILSMKEYNRFAKGMFVWVGFKCEYLEYKNVERVAGETSWSFWKLFRYAIDGIIEYTNAPLAFAMWGGGFITGIMFIELLILLIMALCGKAVTIQTVILSAVLFMGGVLLLCVGIIGEYLAKTYDEVRERPHYIIKKYYD